MKWLELCIDTARDGLDKLEAMLSALGIDGIDIENEEDLGRYFTQDLPIPEELKDYFDYEAYGRDFLINEGGHLAPGGYIVQTSGDFKEFYHGIEDIPAEHKVFAFPQLSVREQMAAYKEVIDRFPQAAERPRPEQGHTDR